MGRAARIVGTASDLLAAGTPFTQAFVSAVHSVPGHTVGDRALAMRIFATIHGA